MSATNSPDLTGLLQAANAGDERAQAEAYAQIEPRLFALIQALLQGQPVGHSLSVASLANQAYRRFLGASLHVEDSEKVFGWFCTTIRNLIIDRARRRRRRLEKAGTLPDVPGPADRDALDLRLDLDDAIQRLKQSPSQERREAGLVFELCYYGAHEVAVGADGLQASVGRNPMPVQLAARTLGLSQATAYRRLKEANELLKSYLRDYRQAAEEPHHDD